MRRREGCRRSSHDLAIGGCQRWEGSGSVAAAAWGEGRPDRLARGRDVRVGRGHRGRARGGRSRGWLGGRGGPRPGTVAVDRPLVPPVDVHHAGLGRRGGQHRRLHARVGERGTRLLAVAKAPDEPAVVAHRPPHDGVGHVVARTRVARVGVQRDALPGGVVGALVQGNLADRDTRVAEGRAVHPDGRRTTLRPTELDRVAHGGLRLGQARHREDRRDDTSKHHVLHGLYLRVVTFGAVFLCPPFVQLRRYSDLNERRTNHDYQRSTLFYYFRFLIVSHSPYLSTIVDDGYVEWGEIGLRGAYVTYAMQSLPRSEGGELWESGGHGGQAPSITLPAASVRRQGSATVPEMMERGHCAAKNALTSTVPAGGATRNTIGLMA